MSRIAVISDIHANLEALRAVLDDIRYEQCSDIVCLGDVVGYDADPSACVEIVRSLKCPVVKGNHDEQVSNADFNGEYSENRRMNPFAKAAMEWTRAQLNEEQLTWLRRLQLMRLIQPFTIVHATMDSARLWNYVFNVDDAISNFTRQFTDICFHGHTHRPKIFYKEGSHVEEETDILSHLASGIARFRPQSGRKYFINVGSVGQPRDGDPRACYAIFDRDTYEIIFKRVSYDIETAMSKIIAAGLPDYLADRLAKGV